MRGELESEEKPDCKSRESDGEGDEQTGILGEQTMERGRFRLCASRGLERSVGRWRGSGLRRARHVLQGNTFEDVKGLGLRRMRLVLVRAVPPHAIPIPDHTVENARRQELGARQRSCAHAAGVVNWRDVNSFRLILVACAVSLFCGRASAQIVYSNGVAGIYGGQTNDLDRPNIYSIAPFTMETASQFNHLSWYGLHDPVEVTNRFAVSLRFRPAEGGSLQTSLNVSGVVRTPGPLTTFGLPTWNYEGDVPSTPLNAGQYFITIYDANVDGNNWSWAYGLQQSGDGFSSKYPFTLSQVPEPSTVVLGVVFAAALLLIRRRSANSVRRAKRQ
jgi:hypothetical protein